MFDMFTRGSNSDAQRGLGLGLYIAREFVQLLGGEVDLFSAGTDKGCQATIRVPL